MPTPEADVEVPPLPQGAQGTSERTGGVKWLPLIMVVGFVTIVAIANQAGSGGGGSAQSGGVNGYASSASYASASAQGGSSGETFTNENYAELYSDPDAYEGAKVNVAGQLLETPEVVEDELAFQMFADAENSEWNTIVYTDQTDLDLSTDDYVRVQGEVLGTFEGQNAFGANLQAPMVQASDVTPVSAGQAIDPAKKVIEVEQTLGDQGFEITLQKIELGEESTRAYVTMRNNTGRGASFYTFDAKIQQGSTQIDYLEDSYAYYDEEPQSDLRPGVQTEGILAFGPVNPDKPFELVIPWSSDNYSLNAKPVVFQVSP